MGLSFKWMVLVRAKVARSLEVIEYGNIVCKRVSALEQEFQDGRLHDRYLHCISSTETKVGEN